MCDARSPAIPNAIAEPNCEKRSILFRPANSQSAKTPTHPTNPTRHNPACSGLVHLALVELRISEAEISATPPLHNLVADHEHIRLRKRSQTSPLIGGPTHADEALGRTGASHATAPHRFIAVGELVNVHPVQCLPLLQLSRPRCQRRPPVRPQPIHSLTPHTYLFQTHNPAFAYCALSLGSIIQPTQHPAGTPFELERRRELCETWQDALCQRMIPAR